MLTHGVIFSNFAASFFLKLCQLNKHFTLSWYHSCLLTEYEYTVFIMNFKELSLYLLLFGGTDNESSCCLYVQYMLFVILELHGTHRKSFKQKVV